MSTFGPYILDHVLKKTIKINYIDNKYSQSLGSFSKSEPWLKKKEDERTYWYQYPKKKKKKEKKRKEKGNTKAWWAS